MNRVNKRDELRIENVSSFFDLPVLAAIPEDPNVRKSIEAKNPIILDNPTHRVSSEIRKVSDHLLGKESRKEEGFIDKILALFKW